jgi:hypothetical protein
MAGDIHTPAATKEAPIRSQSSWRWNYLPNERTEAQRPRTLQPNVFVRARA